MDKDKCGHCGEYGFQDGYSHPLKVCKISGCIDANECSDKLKADLAGKGKDYIMAIFQNKEKGINAKKSEQDALEFAEKEKIKQAQEKMKQDADAKKKDDEAKQKEADELKERAKKVGLAETATKEEVELKEKAVKDADDLKARAVKVGLPETATLADVEAKEKEVVPPEKKEPAKCATCGQVLPEKPAEPAKPEEKKEEPAKPEEKPAEKPAEEVKPKADEVKPEETK